MIILIAVLLTVIIFLISPKFGLMLLAVAGAVLVVALGGAVLAIGLGEALPGVFMAVVCVVIVWDAARERAKRNAEETAKQQERVT